MKVDKRDSNATGSGLANRRAGGSGVANRRTGKSALRQKTPRATSADLSPVHASQNETAILREVQALRTQVADLTTKLNAYDKSDAGTVHARVDRLVEDAVQMGNRLATAETTLAGYEEAEAETDTKADAKKKDK